MNPENTHEVSQKETEEQAVADLGAFMTPENYAQFSRLANEGATKEELYATLTAEAKEKLEEALKHDDNASIDTIIAAAAILATPFGGGPITAGMGVAGFAHAVVEQGRSEKALEENTKLRDQASLSQEQSQIAYERSRNIVTSELIKGGAVEGPEFLETTLAQKELARKDGERNISKKMTTEEVEAWILKQALHPLQQKLDKLGKQTDIAREDMERDLSKNMETEDAEESIFKQALIEKQEREGYQKFVPKNPE